MMVRHGTLEGGRVGVEEGCGLRCGRMADDNNPVPERPVPFVYANVLRITTGAYDLVMDFGFSTPEQTMQGSEEYEPMVRVVMSLAHAKTMIPILAQVIAQYEQQVGPITAPGFEDQPKE